MAIYTYVITGTPRPSRAPRVVRQHAYDELAGLKRELADEVMAQHEGIVIRSPVVVKIKYIFPIPTSKAKRVQQAMLKGAIRHRHKPDLDNLAKLTCDVLRKSVIKDDALIDQLILSKCYGADPCTYISITTDDEDDDNGQ